MSLSLSPMSLVRAILVLTVSLASLGCSVPQLRPEPHARTTYTDPARMIVVTLVNPATVGMRGAGSTWRGWEMSKRYEVGSAVQGAVRDLSADYALEQVDAWPIGVLGVHCVVFQISDPADRTDLIKQLSADGRVETVQAMNAFTTASIDSRKMPGRDMQYSLEAMQLEQAHLLAQGRGVRIAVIDTGVDHQHPQLLERVSRHFDFVGQPDAQFTSEKHGTAVAGVIAASASATGIVGVAPQAELLALKACWPQSKASALASCNSFTLARALSAAIELDAAVLNLSLTGPADPLLARLVQTAVSRGAVVVGALPENGRASGFPASLDGVIVVRSLGSNIVRESVAAPGEDVVSTAPGASYALSSGSSLAAAHVSGVIALLKEHNPSLRPAELEQILLSSLAPELGGNGALSVNACNAVSLLLGGQPCARGQQFGMH